jgi:cyclophilin family peptidyl-prolyl cis-trans isomerase
MNKPSPRRTRQILLESLETRRLLTFQVVTPLSDLTTSASSSTVSLADHFHDPDATSSIVRIQVQPYTNTPAAGTIDIQLTDSVTPLTVANFLNYVNSGRYNNTVIHRSEPGFVVQAGGYRNVTGFPHVTTDAAVANEYAQVFAADADGKVNTRATVAMAKVGGDPNSATSEWFFNLADNSSNLDNQNGGFTTFGSVVGTGMTIVDAIAALPRDGSVPYGGSAFSNLVIINWATANATYQANFTNSALISSVSVAGSQLLLSYAPGMAGTSEVTVTATSLANPADTATDTFTVTVNQPVISVTDAGSPVSDNVTVVNVGTAGQGATASKTVRITNTGDQALTFGTPTLPAGFVIQTITTQGGSVVGSLPTLAAGEYVDLTLATVATNAGGAKSGTLVIPSNDPDTASFDLKLSSFVNYRQVGVTYSSAAVTSGQGTAVNLGTSAAATFTATFTIRNNGTGLPLVLGTPTLPAGFTLVSGLPTTLAAGASVDLILSIDTTTVGTKSGNVVINSDDPVTPAFTVPVTAVVSHGVISVVLVNGDASTTPVTDNQASPINYGTITQNSGTLNSRTFRITNTGDAALTFSPVTEPAGFFITSPNRTYPSSGPSLPPNLGTLAPGQSIEITVTQRADTGGDKSGLLSLNSSDPHAAAFDIPLTGHVNYRKLAVTFNAALLVAGAANLAPTINAGSMVEGAPMSLSFTVANTGDTLDLGNLSLSLPAGFSIDPATPLPATLTPGQSATVTIRVNPTSVGNLTGTIVFNSNDPLYALAPVGVPSGFRVPVAYTVNYRRLVVTNSAGTDVPSGATLNFGTLTQGDLNQVTYRLTNDGDLPMTLGAPTVPAGFTLAGTFPTVLAPGASADITLSLDTLGPRGSYAGAFSFTTDDPTRLAFTLNLAGRVLGKGIVVSLAGSAIPFGGAQTIDFGRLRRGTTGHQVTLTVANSGVIPLDFQATSIPAGYSVVSGLPDTLAPGASTQLTIALDASAAGTFNGELHIVSSDPDRASFDIPLAAAVSLPVTLGKGGTPSVTYTDSDGTLTTLTLSGPGSAILDFFGVSPFVAGTKQAATVNPKGVTLGAITLAGTKAATSVLTVTAKGGNRSVDLADVSGSPLKALSAPTAKLTGTLSVNVKSVDLGSASGATLSLPAGASVKLATTATNTTLVSRGNLKSLTAKSWTGGSITANSVDSLNIASHFATDLTVKKHVSGAVKGNLTGGTWVVGSINKLTAANTGAGWNATVTGAVTNFALTRNLAGSLTAKLLTSLTVGGSITNATLTATGSVGTVTVKGNTLNSSLRSNGKVASFSTGAFTNSRLYAGLQPDSTPPATPAVFKSSAAVTSFTAKSFSNSSLAARTLTKVTVGTLKTRNAGNAHGIAAGTIASLAAKVDTGKTLTLANVKSGTALTAALKAQKIASLNDLRILMA